MGQFSERIRQVRTMRGITQEQLAEMADISRVMIGRYETTDQLPALDTLIRIADALGVELKAYHVASDYLSAVGDKYGYDFEGSLTGDKSVSVVFDNSKLKRIVPQMTTTIPFNRGVRIALDYVLSHPELQVEDPEFDEWCDKVIERLEESKKDI